MSVLAGPSRNSVKHIMSTQEYVTDVETCEFIYKWTIKKFSQYKTDIIQSSKFSSHFSDFNDVWILKINPCRKSSETHQYYEMDYMDYMDLMDNPTPPPSIKYVSVQLQLQSFNDTLPLFTKCKISINPDISKIIECKFNTFPKESEWINILSTDLLRPPYQYLQNDDLKISCTLTISKELKNNSSLTSTIIPTGQLNEDLKKLLLNEKSADVTIKVGKKSFRVIQGILAARSPVFHTMFDHKLFEETKYRQVVIEDIEEDAFEEFLHYIYTDETKNVNKMPMKVLKVAEKYQVDRLKTICEGIICQTLNSNNVTSILVFSEKYNAEKLNKECLIFIKKNLPVVLSKEAFQAYIKTHPEVIVSVL